MTRWDQKIKITDIPKAQRGCAGWMVETASSTTPQGGDHDHEDQLQAPEVQGEGHRPRLGHALEAHVSDDDIATLIDPVRRHLLDGRHAAEHVLGVTECIAALKTPITADMPVLG